MCGKDASSQRPYISIRVDLINSHNTVIVVIKGVRNSNFAADAQISTATSQQILVTDTEMLHARITLTRAAFGFPARLTGIYVAPYYGQIGKDSSVSLAPS